MIERRLFDDRPSEDLGGLKARRYSFTGTRDYWLRGGWGRMRVWNDEETATADAVLQTNAN